MNLQKKLSSFKIIISSRFTGNLNKVLNTLNIYRFSLALHSPTVGIFGYKAVVLSNEARGNIRSFKDFEIAPVVTRFVSIIVHYAFVCVPLTWH